MIGGKCLIWVGFWFERLAIVGGGIFKKRIISGLIITASLIIENIEPLDGQKGRLGYYGMSIVKKF